LKIRLPPPVEAIGLPPPVEAIGLPPPVDEDEAPAITCQVGTGFRVLGAPALGASGPT
jgi:hypothetical protein